MATATGETGFAVVGVNGLTRFELREDFSIHRSLLVTDRSR